VNNAGNEKGSIMK